MKTVEQIITDTLKVENHDERYLYGRWHDVPKDTHVLTCEDLPQADACCDSCHTFYIVYEMHIVRPCAQTRNQYAWVCFAKYRQMFPEVMKPDELTPQEEKLLRAIFGEDVETISRVEDLIENGEGEIT